MHRSLQSQASSQNSLLEQKHVLEEKRASLAQLQVALAAQRRRICLDLQAIYPIVSVDDETLRFTIRGIFLAAAGKWDGRGEEDVATALGWTAHLVLLLSLYLGVPLRYPVQPVGGRSLIKDPVSIMMGSRTYQPRFSFGVLMG
jgi:UV radiation resistance-associated gene protein